MSKFAAYLLLAVFCSTSFCAAGSVKGAQENAVSVKDFEKSWVAREQRLKSISVDWKVKHTIVKGSMMPPGLTPPKLNPKNLIVPPEDHTYEGLFSLKIDGKNVWYQHTRDIWSTHEEKFVQRTSTRLFDGAKNSSLTTGNETASAAGIGAEAYAIPLGYDDTRAIALAARLSVLPSSVFEAERLTVSPVRPTVEGVRCIALVDQKASTTYFIDPTKDYSFVHWSRQHKKGQTLESLDVTLEDRNGVWLPKSWHFQRFMPDGSQREDIVAFDVTYRLDESMQAHELEIKYPPKTLIVDNANPTKTGGLSVITTEGKKVAISPQQLRQTGFEELTTPKTIWSSYIVWASMGIVLIMAFGAGVLYKNRRFLFKGDHQ